MRFGFLYEPVLDTIKKNFSLLFGPDFCRQLLMVDSFRFIYCALRAHFYINIVKGLKVYKSQSEFVRQELPSGKSAVEHNLEGVTNDLSSARSLRLIKPLSCIETLRPLQGNQRPFGVLSDINYLSTANVLTIGPRTEAEIFCLYAHGFDLAKISALDLISYSPLIELGDMHSMPYPDNNFDVVMCACTLPYSHAPKFAAQEIIRVAKSSAIVAIMLDVTSTTYKETLEQYGYSLATPEDVINLFSDTTKQIDLFWTHFVPANLQDPNGSTVSLIFKVTK